MKDDGQAKGLRRVLHNDVQGVFFAVFLWVIIGSINIYSATYVEATIDGSLWAGFFVKHLVSLVLGFIILMAMYRMDYRRLRSQKVLNGMAVVLVILLVAVLVGGTVVNGARRWLQFGPVSLQPSEFAKLGSVIWAAAYVERQRWKQKYIHFFEYYEFGPSPGSNGRVPFFARFLLMPLVYALLTILQPDMGTAMLILGFGAILAAIGGIGYIRRIRGPMLYVAVGGTLAVLGILSALVYLSPYRWERILAYIDPWSHAQGIGYQTVQSLLAVGSGGVLGQGLGNGTAKYFYLPEAHTDFAFAVWSQETGLVGSLALLAIVLTFTWYGLRIAQQARDYFGAFVAFGITLIISGQALFNMMMVCGAMPVTGVPLPFVSYGGSSLMLNLGAVGILASIGRYSLAAQQSPRVGTRGEAPSLREETLSRFSVEGSSTSRSR